MSLVSYVVFNMEQAIVIVVYYILCHRYTPWTALAPALGLNAFVHVVMHFYYGYTVPIVPFTSLHRFSSCFFLFRTRIQMFSFTSTIESTLHPARMRLSFYAHFLLHFLTISRACYCVWIVALLFLVKIRHRTCCFPLLTSQQRQMPLDQ